MAFGLFPGLGNQKAPTSDDDLTKDYRSDPFAKK